MTEVPNWVGHREGVGFCATGEHRHGPTRGAPCSDHRWASP